MFCKIPLNNAELIMTKGEYGFKEVLSDFNNSKEIIIITYNISNQKTGLLDLIRNLKPNVKITFVTNIPKRFDKYFNNKVSIDAKKNIEMYLASLNADKFKSELSTFFNFKNHIKIVMTDSIAYIGSQNFSEESMENFEMGVLIRDKSTIEEIRDRVVKSIIDNSIPYGGSEIDDYICKFQYFSNCLIEIKDSLIETGLIEDENEETYENLYIEDLNYINNMLSEIEKIKKEIVSKSLYTSINWEEDYFDYIIESIVGNINSSEIERYINYDEFEKTKILIQKFFDLESNKNIEKYLKIRQSKSDVEELLKTTSNLSLDDMKMLGSIRDSVYENKKRIYVECKESIQSIYAGIDELSIAIEEVLLQLMKYKNNEDIINNTK